MNSSSLPFHENLISTSPPINIGGSSKNLKNNGSYNTYNHNNTNSNNNNGHYSNSSSPLIKQQPNLYPSDAFPMYIKQNYQQGPHTPLLLSEGAINNNNNYIDPMDYAVDENEVFTRQLNMKLKQNANNNKSKKNNNSTSANEEYFDTNSDLGFLTVASKEDLIVCLNVLKKEIFQFKNLSQSLLSRLVNLEKGIGNEKSIRLSPNLQRYNNDGENDSSTSSNSPNLNSSNVFNNNNNNNSPSSSPPKLNNEVLLSNAISEIHRLIEKQKQYDSILSQREKIWDLELNKLTMSIINRFPNSQQSSGTNSIAGSNGSNGSSNIDYNFNSDPLLDDYLYQQQQQQQQQLDLEMNYQKQKKQEEEEEENRYIIIKVDPNSNSIITKISVFINRSYKFIFYNRSSTFWRKVLVLTIIIVLWPIIAHFMWKLIQSFLQRRGKNIQTSQLNKSNNTNYVKSNNNKLKNISLPQQSYTGGNTTAIGKKNGLFSRLFNLKRNNIINSNSNLHGGSGIGIGGNNGSGNNGGSNVLLSGEGNIRAPDIVKAIIQGASTGDGGSNNNLTNNLTNNTISTMNTMLNSVIPNNPNNSNSSSNISIPTISPTSLSNISSSLPNQITPITTSSNLMNNFTPSVISSLNLPSSSSSSSSNIDIPSSLSLNNHPSIPLSNYQSAINIADETNANQSNSTLLRMVKNLLQKPTRS